MMVFFDEQLVMFCFVNLFILRNTGERLLVGQVRKKCVWPGDTYKDFFC